MILLFLHGPAASGKHTIGTRLSEALGLPLFHNHLVVDVAKTLFDFGEPGFVAIREQMWRTSFSEAAKAHKSFIFTFNPERTVDPQLIHDLDSVIRSHRGQVIYIELTCSDSEILKRIDNESRRQFGKLTDGAVYKKYKSEGGFEFPAFPKPLISINTETSTPDQSAEKIIAALKAEQIPGF